ncbi:MAG: MlaD family protein [Desulfosarcinaceae bacterium]|nr:MlaD family protein [Desulfosarcinaceae bacterium]
MELAFSRIEKLVGLFVVGITILLVFSIIMIGRGKDWFADHVIYYTVFDESYNLKVDAAVKLFKADIGRVREITVSEDRVRIKLAILARYRSRIRTDTVAVVESPTLIGSEYISIVPGSSAAQLLEENAEIPSEARKSLADIMAEFEVEETARKLVEALQDLSELAIFLKDPQGPLISTLNNVNAITANVAAITAAVEGGSGTLGELVASRTLMAKVETQLAQLGSILSDLRQASAKTPVTLDLVNDNLLQLASAGQALGSGIAEIRAAVATLQVSLDNIAAGSDDVPEITRTFRIGIQEIRDGVADIDEVVQSLQKNILIRGNLPEVPTPEVPDAGLRE